MNNIKNVLVALVLVSLASCAPSTQIVKIWQAPGVTVTSNSTNRTLVIALVKDEGSRQIIENELVKKFKMDRAVASYTILPIDSLKRGNKNLLAQAIAQGHFNYILMMRLNNVKDETTYDPNTSSYTGTTQIASNVSIGVYYDTYDNYFGYSSGFYVTPDYYSKTKSYYVETTVYSVNPNKLIWNCTTQTVNPKKMDKAISSIADAVTDAMENNRFLQ
ncbi:MAG TPA: hypothetical protein VK559_09915 [Ferruginibacter sp.]|nr:hypothetical protein [Ferruginibacter sp.]